MFTLSPAGILLVSFSLIAICECNHNKSSSSQYNYGAEIYSRRNMLPYIPDEFLSVPQLIRKSGYPVETHVLDSKDGYLLKLHRIPYGKSCPSAPDKSVVFLQHGLFGSSADWVISGPKRALAYFLADAGYDVWLGNFRGSVYSDSHNSLNTSDSSYWNFSWEELGELDLAAFIDYALHLTGQNCLFYVGHSMGSAVFFVLMSSQPHYNNKIRASFQLAPAFYFINNNNFSVMKNLPAVGKFVTNEHLQDYFERKECLNHGEVPASVCNSLRFLIGGYNAYQIDKNSLPSILSHQNAGTSAKAFCHYAQAVVNGELCQFDYGPAANLEIYGCPKPPGYNLSIVTSEIHIYYSKIDPVVGECEIEELCKILPNVARVNEVSVYTHCDFLWGINARMDTYDDIITQMKKHKSSCYAGTATCGESD